MILNDFNTLLGVCCVWQKFGFLNKENVCVMYIKSMLDFVEVTVYNQRVSLMTLAG